MDPLERFRPLVEERFRFLEGHGFRRSPADETQSSVGASVVYVGMHVGFLISYDVRDRQVDLRVTRVRNRRLLPIREGGYSRDLLLHLVKHRGYRGGWNGRGAAGHDPLEGMVDAWAKLLQAEGGALLDDTVEALPAG